MFLTKYKEQNATTIYKFSKVFWHFSETTIHGNSFQAAGYQLISGFLFVFVCVNFLCH